MGDLGYLDAQDRFWFCGRKSHRLRTTKGSMFTIPCEAIFNAHEKIYRSALVGIGEADAQTPVLIAEPLPQHWPQTEPQRQELIDQLKAIAGKHWQTDGIQLFLLHQSLPVDIRHNSKIFREQLRGWAGEKLK